MSVLSDALDEVKKLVTVLEDAVAAETAATPPAPDAEDQAVSDDEAKLASDEAADAKADVSAPDAADSSTDTESASEDTAEGSEEAAPADPAAGVQNSSDVPTA